MGELKLYKDLKSAPTEDERFQIIAHAIEEAKHQPDLSELATKADLLNGLNALEIKFLKAINDQTKFYLAGIAALGLIFKVAEMLIK